MKKLREINIRDPFVFAENNTYYLIGSQGYDGVEFAIYTSNDMINWSEPKIVFKRTEQFWATMNFWAPEIHKYNGKYYIFASFKDEKRCRGSQILVSDTIDGEYIPLTEYPVTPCEWECLDGTLYVDKNSVPHMIFCHEWIQVKDGEICEIPLSKDLKEAIGPARVLFKASDFKKVKAFNDGYITDGPFLIRGKNDLYMLWSSFAEQGYFCGVAKSDNGEISGNWIFQDELLYEKDGGHGMIFQDFNKNLKLVLHTSNSGDTHPEIFDILEENGKLMISNN